MTSIIDLTKEIKWTLDEALELIRKLQPLAHASNFHLALAGGVLNKGESIKDLDILAVPLHNSHYKDKEQLIKDISRIYGAECRYGSEDYDGEEARYDQLLVFEKNTSNSAFRENFKRLDVFIYE